MTRMVWPAWELPERLSFVFVYAIHFPLCNFPLNCAAGEGAVEEFIEAALPGVLMPFTGLVRGLRLFLLLGVEVCFQTVFVGIEHDFFTLCTVWIAKAYCCTDSRVIAFCVYIVETSEPLLGVKFFFI